MDQVSAFNATVELAEVKGMPELPGNPLGLRHLQDMRDVIDQEEYSKSKIGRWLGWAQAAVVAADVGLTLEDMKLINRSYAND